MNRFEQLIEYVINDEEQKAKELFHDIVVEKSRQIYENLMQEEEDLDEAEDIEEGDDDLEEGAMGGDAADDLIDEVEAEEQSGMNMEAEGDDEDMDDMDDMSGGDDDMGGFGGDEGGSSEPATKDDIMNLEDKLDELMAEFEGLMGGGDDMGDGDDFGPEEGGDAIEMDDTEEMGMMEALQLKAAPKPVTAEQGNGKAGPVAFNSGSAGMASKPVHTGTSLGGVHDTSAYRNTVKDLGVTPTQDAGKKAFKTAAPAPVKSQASGVNNKSPLPGGRKG